MLSKKLYLLTIAVALGTPLTPRLAGQANLTTLYNFPSDNVWGVIYAKGALYGATYQSGISANCGTIFELQPPSTAGGAWTESTVFAFGATSDGICDLIDAPIMGTNGALYGMSNFGGQSNQGAVFELQPPASAGAPWTEAVIYSVSVGPLMSLINGPNGSLYLADSYGTNGNGAIVQLHPPATSSASWTSTVLYNMPGGPGGSSPNSLTIGPKGVLFGTTQYGGQPTGLGRGTVFELIPPATTGGAWTGKVIHAFQGSDGNSPNLVVASPGAVLYGTAHSQGSLNPDPVFQMVPPASAGGSWTYTTIGYAGLGYACAPGLQYGTLIVSKGNLYGTACVPDGGVVYQLTPPATTGGSWTNNTLYTFTSGQSPVGAFVLTSGGVIYGATSASQNLPQAGTVYELTTK